MRRQKCFESIFLSTTLLGVVLLLLALFIHSFMTKHTKKLAGKEKIRNIHVNSDEHVRSLVSTLIGDQFSFVYQTHVNTNIDASRVSDVRSCVNLPRFNV